MQKEWQVKWVPIGTIKKDPNNRNKHPKDQIERLTQLMSHYGWVGNPLVVSKESGLLKAGEGRLLSAKKAKLKKVPVHFNQFDTPEDAYGWAISDNAITSWAELELGEINQDLGDLGPDFDIEMLGIKDFELEPADKYGEASNYSRKISAPIYEPTGIKPEISETYDTEKLNSLLQEIEEGHLSKDEKQFLQYAAHRHVVFNYEKIAEFYAHSSIKIQNLMEKSALVIIDYNKAIELGFVKVSNEIAYASEE